VLAVGGRFGHDKFTTPLPDPLGPDSSLADATLVTADPVCGATVEADTDANCDVTVDDDDCDVTVDVGLVVEEGGWLTPQGVREVGEVRGERSWRRVLGVVAVEGGWEASPAPDKGKTPEK
jgi:hypothetical protein